MRLLLPFSLILTTYAHAQCVTEWFPGGSEPGFNAVVRAVARFDDGGGESVYAAGDFTRVAGTSVAHIARWNGQRWTAVGSGIDGVINTLCVHDGALVAGGDFNSAGGTVVASIAKWDGFDWSPFGAGIVGTVHALLSVGDALYASGSFAQAGSEHASNIAVWNGGAWSPLGAGTNAPVLALAMHAGQLHAGGAFTQAGEAQVARVARWDGAAWHSVGAELTTGEVRALAVFQDALMAGGSFNQTNFNPRIRFVARFDGTLWASVIPNAETFAAVDSLAVWNGSLHTAGSQYIRRWDGTAWSYFASMGTADPLTLLADESRLLVGGSFSSLGSASLGISAPAHGVAEWNGVDWADFDRGTNGVLRCFQTVGTDLFAGGSFTRIGDIAASRVARFDGTRWHALGGGMNGTVRAFAQDVAGVYAAGSFTSADGLAAARVARWDGLAWQPMADGFNGSVNALFIHGGRLWAGGSFTATGPQPLQNIAYWDGAAWVSPPAGGTSGEVMDFASYGGALHVSGRFEFAGPWRVNCIARLGGDLATWNELGGGLDYPFYEIDAIESFGGSLYAGGYWYFIGGVHSYGFARWDGTQWNSVAAPVYNGVSRLHRFDNALYILPMSSPVEVIRWDGANAATMDFTPTFSSVVSIGSHDGELWVGGGFREVLGEPSWYFARYGQVGPTGDLDFDNAVGLSDLALLLAEFGRSGPVVLGDIDDDGDVDLTDLTMLLSHFGQQCMSP